VRESGLEQIKVCLGFSLIINNAALNQNDRANRKKRANLQALSKK
jgi:hypothetical protein